MKNLLAISIFILFAFSVSAQISMEKTDEGVLIKEKNKNVLFYQTKPKSKDGKYERCNYVHPLWGVDGTVLTEDFPADHLHQRGIFWAWHQILIDGKTVGDGWALIDYRQEVKSTKFELNKNGSGTLTAEVFWKSDKWKKDGVVVPYLKESTKITVHQQKKHYRKIDFEISLLALADNLQIGGADNDKGYSGFSARIILPANVKFSGTKGEVTPERTAVVSDGYINISGAYAQNGGDGGIVIADNQANPMYPQRWILRKEKSMQNPVFPGREPVEVPTDKPLVLKYSLIVYTGELSNRQITKIIKQ